MSLRYKIIHWLQWRRHQARQELLRRRHPLRYLFFEITRRCNLSCAYCGSDCTERTQSEELEIEDWLRIADQLARDFTPGKVMIAVTGGEPLTKPGLLELFHRLHRLGFPFGMVTNGTLLDRDKARELVATGIRSISVSLDGPAEINDRLRGKGSAQRAIEALGHLKEAGFDGKLEVLTTVTKPALASLVRMRRSLAKRQIALWRLLPVMPIGRAHGRTDLLLDGGDFKRLLRYIKTARRDGLLPAPEFAEEGFLGDGYEGRVRPYLYQCQAGITVGGIKCDGTLGACPELAPAFDQGDIRTESFKEVWETRYQLLRDRSWMRKGTCEGCDAFNKCGGGSLHLYEGPEAEFARCTYLMCRGC
jgi:radical SAM protein with 4Fe4S-binding SPASM domain